MTLSQRTLSAVTQEYNSFKSLHENTIINWSSRITIFFILCCLLMLILGWKTLPSQVPLWYSRPWGEDRLASPYDLFLLPLASLCWYIINSALSLHVTKDHLVFSQILFLSSLLVSIFSCVTVTMIIWIIS